MKANFKTIRSAVKYLEDKYGMDYVLNNPHIEIILINGIETIVSHGLRMDPCTDIEYKYFRRLERNEKYEGYEIRLS